MVRTYRFREHSILPSANKKRYSSWYPLSTVFLGKLRVEPDSWGSLKANFYAKSLAVDSNWPLNDDIYGLWECFDAILLHLKDCRLLCMF